MILPYYTDINKEWKKKNTFLVKDYKRVQLKEGKKSPYPHIYLHSH